MIISISSRLNIFLVLFKYYTLVVIEKVFKMSRKFEKFGILLVCIGVLTLIVLALVFSSLFSEYEFATGAGFFGTVGVGAIFLYIIDVKNRPQELSQED